MISCRPVASVSPPLRCLFRLAAAATVQSWSLICHFHFPAATIAIILLPLSLSSWRLRCCCLSTVATKSILHSRCRCFYRIVTAVSAFLPYHRFFQVNISPPLSLLMFLMSRCRHLVATTLSGSCRTCCCRLVAAVSAMLKGYFFYFHSEVCAVAVAVVLPLPLMQLPQSFHRLC